MKKYYTTLIISLILTDLVNFLSGKIYAQTEISFETSADTYINSGYAKGSYNYGGSETIQTNPYFLTNSEDQYRGILLKWNITDIPIQASVTAASITFYVTDPSVYTYSLFNMRRSWTEGTNDGATGTGASWNYYGAGSGSWGTAGAANTSSDRYSTNLWDATAGSFAITGYVTFSLNNEGLKAVQSWIKTPGSNYGLTIQNYSGTAGDAWIVASKENNSYNGPVLNITYSLVPILPDLDIILGRPTNHSVLANIIPDSDGEISLEYGINSGQPGNYPSQTGIFTCTSGQPVEIVMDGLTANSKYYYRPRFRYSSGDSWIAGDESSFYTQRRKGETFTFTIVSDSHLGQYGGQTSDEKDLYQRTIDNIKIDNPDFHMDLGDTYAMDPSPLGTGMTVAEADAAYYVERPYLRQICNSSPFFFVLGNHENEEGWNFDDVFTAPDQSLAIVGMQARKKYYPNPIPDDFYTGNTDPLPQVISGDLNREDYYAWTWGEALFVVIDPYHYSKIWPSEGNSYGGEGMDGEAQGDRWDWTLGIQQYLWLKSTLENSHAKYKFVFSHHVTGGNSVYGRGGIKAAPYFEWGGKNADGSWGFDTERPASEGWDLPIHQLMVKNGVSVYFHGHDHIFAEEELDGIVYLECPKPDDAGYTWEPYGYGYTENHYPDGIVIQNSGHIRVTVSPDSTTVQYIRAYLPGDGINRDTAYSVSVYGAVGSSIQITSPNGGENFEVGTNKIISWNSENITGNVHVEFSIDNGSNWSDITASTINTGTYSWTVPNIVSANCLIKISDLLGETSDVSDAVFAISRPAGPHFIPVMEGNGFDHMNFYILTAKLDGIDIVPGDEIGIFDGELCVGSGIITEILNGTTIYLSIKISRDDPYTQDIDGYTVGNTASFRIWDSDNFIEVLSPDITYVTGDNIFTPGNSTWLHINGEVYTQQDIELINGWNIISLHVIPDNPDLQIVVQSLIDAGNLIKVQDESGNAIEYNPISGSWFNNIGNWINTEGYKIKVNANTILSVRGRPIKETIILNLSEGWNIISYPVSNSNNALEILDQLISSGHLIKVQNESGDAIEYNPITGTWINDIGNFNPDEGYKIKVSENELLVIDVSSFSSTKSGNIYLQKSVSTRKSIIHNANSHFKPIWSGNGLDHMNIYLSEKNKDTYGFAVGDEIGIFDGDRCIGSGIITNTSDNLYSVKVSADDPTTSAIDGFIIGNPMQVKLWKSSAQAEINLNDIEFAEGSARKFESMGTSIIIIESKALGINSVNTSFGALSDIYPNPFINKIIIPFILTRDGEINLSIYNQMGIKVKTLKDSHLSNGKYLENWNSTNDQGLKVSPGIYFVRLRIENQLFVKTILLLKD